jgi:hypothetical protein
LVPKVGRVLPKPPPPKLPAPDAPGRRWAWVLNTLKSIKIQMPILLITVENRGIILYLEIFNNKLMIICFLSCTK